MTKQQFTQDLQKIYDELQTRQNELNGFYALLEGEHARAKSTVDVFLDLMDLEDTKEHTMAALTRVVNLREDALEQVLEKAGNTVEQIQLKKELAYGFVSTLHMGRHDSFMAWVEKNQLLTPFYRGLILCVHHVGASLSVWQSYWTNHIINTINPELSRRFDGDDDKVFAYLQENDLLDCDEEGNVTDRCYSVLVKDKDGNYESKAYVDAFVEQTQDVLVVLEQSIVLLEHEKDEVFGQDLEWIKYFKALHGAFSESNTSKLVTLWANVDRAWMAIKTPLQIGHPLEYYEDHYRKAVALEWDLRIINPRLQEGSRTQNNIKGFAKDMAIKFAGQAPRIMQKNLTQVDETQLYIGQPVLYYGAEFNGLFSAQVVPNDENVSAELGKKIFAYADFVMESKKSKPIMKLSVESMGKEFVQKQRALIENNPELWHEIYDISTVGHEYGHILWIDNDTESKMNATGQFKNIEEFKATSGGLMAFFHNERDELKEHVVDDVVSRAVGLMAWREVGEVLPYYCEGLIHLSILFTSGVIRVDKTRVSIDYSQYDVMKEGYRVAYTKLAQSYLDKVDASTFLDNYAQKVEGIYLPKDTNIRVFVEEYYTRYKEIGQKTVSIL